MNKQKAVAIMLANLKGSKKKASNLLEFSEACRFLIREWKINEVSNYFHVSPYMLRQIDKINELDGEVRQLVKDRKLGIEASYQVWRLPKHRQIEAARLMKDMSTEEIRNFIFLLKKNPDLTVSDAKKNSE